MHAPWTALGVLSSSSSSSVQPGWAARQGTAAMQHGTATPLLSSVSTSLAAHRTAAAAMYQHAPTLLVQGNSANLGGALFADTQCNATLLGVQFDSNLARQYGGAILTGDESQLRVSLSTFTGNGDSPCFAPPLVGDYSRITAR